MDLQTKLILRAGTSRRYRKARWFFYIKLPASFALLFLASLALTAVLLLIIQPNRLTQTAVLALILESNGLIFLLNWLPVALVLSAAFFACSRLALSCGLTGLLFILPAVANRLMIMMRHAPLRPLDLWLGMEFIGIAHSIRPLVYIVLLLGFLLYIVLLVLAIRTVKNPRLSLHMRIGGSAGSLILFISLFIFLYGNAGIYESLPMSGSPFNSTHQFQSKGFAYSFLHAMHNSRLERPVYFNQFKEEIENLDTGLITAPEQLPHILMILSEAFSDLPLSPYVDFTGFKDPMANFRLIREESVSGHIVVPHIGGGTADTEFDILTGINARRFRGVPYAFTMVTRPFPGLLSVLNDVGYRSLAMHPGAGWFYNRQNVYPYLGFEAFLCEQYFDRSALRGGYISEEHTIDRLLEEFREHLENMPDIPLFLKAITIQNHGPYYGKYGEIDMNFNATGEAADLSATELRALAQYFYGMLDVDEGLGRLVEYFRKVEEPVLLVYYGDHLPSFPLAIYEALIPAPENAPYGEILIRYKRLPFLIWANDAALPLLNKDLLQSNDTMSAHYLGAALLEILGISEPFFDFVNSLRADYPVVLERTFFPASGGDMLVFDPEVQQNLALYNSWAYFRIVG